MARRRTPDSFNNADGTGLVGLGDSAPVSFDLCTPDQELVVDCMWWLRPDASTLGWTGEFAELSQPSVNRWRSGHDLSRDPRPICAPGTTSIASGQSVVGSPPGFLKSVRLERLAASLHVSELSAHLVLSFLATLHQFLEQRTKL